jgi:hypothetical protein
MISLNSLTLMLLLDEAEERKLSARHRVQKKRPSSFSNIFILLVFAWLLVFSVHALLSNFGINLMDFV